MRAVAAVQTLAFNRKAAAEQAWQVRAPCTQGVQLHGSRMHGLLPDTPHGQGKAGACVSVLSTAFCCHDNESVHGHRERRYSMEGVNRLHPRHEPPNVSE
jgi:hypothetical protein